MTDPHTARFLTKHYHSLQGLVLVPLGALLVILSGGQLFGWPGFSQGDCTLPSVILPIAIALTFAAVIYYRRRFGEVQRRPSNRESASVLIFLGAWWLLAMADMTILHQLPISFTLIGFALFILTIPFSSEGRRRYYFGLAALLVAAAFFPALGIVDKLDLFSGRWLGNLAIGIVLIVGGLLDHLTLVRSLTPPQEE